MNRATLIFFILGYYTLLNGQAAGPGQIDASSEQICDNIKRHISFLGSDSLEGRATGSEGIKIAADYIREQLKKSGIEPPSGHADYFQRIPMHSSAPKQESLLLLLCNGDTLKLNLNKDYLLNKTGSQTFIPAPVPMIFAGYGIHAPEYDYSDYQETDVSGKVVVFLDGEPESDNPEFFKGELNTIYSYLESKQRTAIARGAVGSIMILNPEQKNEKRWHTLKKEYSFTDINLAYHPMGHFSAILSPEMALRILEKSGLPVNEILKMVKSGNLVPQGINCRLSFRGQFRERDFIDQNVIGIITAESEKKDEYIAVTAHYDHLGIGPSVKGDSIYNGVMDNAIGTAALLELSKMFNKNRNKLKRSLIVIFFTGEEKGLLGSKYYNDFPVIPLYKTIANVNIDGMAAFDNFKSVAGIGAELSDLNDILRVTADKLNIGIQKIPAFFHEDEAYTRSDQISFANAGIPSILIMEGMDYINLTYEQGLKLWMYWNDDIYHSPFDDLNQYINFAAVEQHLIFLYNFINDIAAAEQEIGWKKGLFYENIRLRTKAEKR
ncbi:MAG: M28 family peptidase [Calditrichaceae bacterium]|nr:M28 family peptidase [Calditrichaceae bacterium]MBN2709592.1 M28 family peptidase [Calditrichaceae bacterium]RQV92391.1 MAG: M28 family peptidase [Calditrichota bacterium]